MKKQLLFSLCILISTTVFSQSVQLVKDIFPGAGSSKPVMVGTMPNDDLIFIAYEQHGSEYWISDGTSSGTMMLKDIFPGKESGAQHGTGIVLNGKMFLSAVDSAHGRELWITDGTPAGTQMIKDINPGTGSGLVYYIDPVVYNGKVYFYADNGNTGIELWVTDGTEAGTQMVKNISLSLYSNTEIGSYPHSLIVAMGKLYFTAWTDTFGREIYETDGTAAGTRRVTDINPGSNNSLYETSELCLFNNKLFFEAKADTGIGVELYSYDGNSVTLIKDINTNIGEGSGIERGNIMVAGGKMFFSAYTATVNNKPDYMLWVSDGTPAGTKALVDVSDDNNHYAKLLGIIDNKLLYSPYDISIGTHYKEELWISDGTINGTNRIMTVDSVDFGFKAATSCTNYFRGLTDRNSIHDDVYYFGGKRHIVNQQPKYTLWATDGTDAGTYMVIDDNNIGSFFDVYINGNDTWLSVEEGANGYKGIELCHMVTPTSLITLPEPADFFTVYPNPANNGKVTVKIDGTHDKGFLLVTDVTGRMVYNQSVNKTDREVYLDLNNNAKGMYYITLKLGSAEMTHSVVLQ